MVADQPLTVYPKDKKRDKDGNIKHTLKEMDDLYDRWAAKKEKEGSLIGQKIDLNEYMKNKV